MEWKHYLLEVDSDGVAVLTVNHPEKHNAMDGESWQELLDFFRWAGSASQVKAVIVTGAGDKAFVAGADINSLAVRTPAQCLDNAAQDALRLIERCGKPVVAAINGYAFGGGCELAIACDFRIVAENALFALPETSLGILPGAGGTQRLSRLVGLGRAKDMILLGRKVSGREAVDIGLATCCVPQGELMAEAKKLCADLLRRGPLAIRVAKQVLGASLSTGQDTGLILESLALSALCGTKDKHEGTAAFLEKRAPRYQGR